MLINTIMLFFLSFASALTFHFGKSANYLRLVLIISSLCVIALSTYVYMFSDVVFFNYKLNIIVGFIVLFFSIFTSFVNLSGEKK